MAGGSGSAYGSGGMVTKLEAAEIAMRTGCHMVLTTGRPMRPLQALKMAGAQPCSGPPTIPMARAKAGLPAACNLRAACILTPVR